MGLSPRNVFFFSLFSVFSLLLKLLIFSSLICISLFCVSFLFCFTVTLFFSVTFCFLLPCFLSLHPTCLQGNLKEFALSLFIPLSFLCVDVCVRVRVCVCVFVFLCLFVCSVSVFYGICLTMCVDRFSCCRYTKHLQKTRPIVKHGNFKYIYKRRIQVDGRTIGNHSWTVTLD